MVLWLLAAGLFCLIPCERVSAQNSDDFFISGQVLLQGSGQPQSNYPVTVRVNPQGSFQTYNLNTDVNGNFSVNIPGASVIGNDLEIIAEASSCQGIISQSLSNNFGFADSGQVTLSICLSNPCVVNFSFSYDSLGNTISFSGSSNGAVSVFYLFGDGSGTVQGLNQTHTYTNPGAYEVCMTGIDSLGNTCQFCDSVNVYGAGSCVANFSFSSSNPVQPNNITFFNQSISSDSILTLSYDFGDGTGYFAQGSDVWSGVQHLFVSPGEVEVCMTIQDAGFCQSSICQLLTITTDSCLVQLNNSYLDLGDSTLWTLSVAGPSPSAYYSWQYPGGSGTGSTVQFYTDSSLAQGFYPYCLHVIDTLQNCFTIQCDSIGINLPACVSLFSYYPDSQDSSLIYFEAQASGFPSSYSWSIETPTGTTIFSGPNISFDFPGPGIYPICLELGGFNCNSIYCDTLILLPPPSCSVSLAIDSILGRSVSFRANYQSNQQGPFQYTLYTGDGNQFSYQGNSLNHSFPYTYASGGSYQVCIVVEDILQGCRDSICQNYVVNDFPAGLYGLYLYVEQNGAACSDCLVRMFSLDSVSGKWIEEDTLSTDSAGFYFIAAPAGTYLFKAEAEASLSGAEYLLPTYQGDVIFWSSGIPALIPAQVNSMLGCYVDSIRLGEGVLQGGNSVIEGSIREGGFRAEGDPLGGIDILALEINQLAIKRTKSNTNGTYALTNLNPGTYWVYPEVINRTTYPVMIELSADTTLSEINLSVEEDIVYSVKDQTVSVLNHQVIPNPFKEDCTLSFEALETGMVLVSVHDVQGRMLSKESYLAKAGKNMINLRLAMLESGTYLVRVQSGDAAAAIISVVKIP